MRLSGESFFKYHDSFGHLVMMSFVTSFPAFDKTHPLLKSHAAKGRGGECDGGADNASIFFLFEMVLREPDAGCIPYLHVNNQESCMRKIDRSILWLHNKLSYCTSGGFLVGG